MDWMHYSRVFLRNTLAVLCLAAIVLGGIGDLVGGSWFGQRRFVGLIVGLVGIPFTIILILTKYWGDFAGRYGQWWIKKETDDED
jgi:hypothetical protein